MTQIDKENKRPVVEEVAIELARCENVEDSKTKISEDKHMFEVEHKLLVEYTDQTFYSERELNRFLTTLSESQLAETEVMVDDDTFVVFYPVLAPRLGRSGYHFDTDCPRPAVGAEVGRMPESFSVYAEGFEPGSAQVEDERAKARAILLASIRL